MGGCRKSFKSCQAIESRVTILASRCPQNNVEVPLGPAGLKAVEGESSPKVVIDCERLLLKTLGAEEET